MCNMRNPISVKVQCPIGVKAFEPIILLRIIFIFHQFWTVRISCYYYSFYHLYPLDDLLTEANFAASCTVHRTQADKGTAI